MPSPLFSIVLVAPEIPGNTGSIGRTCAALGFELILIRPIAFDLGEKAVRRAGLDYWEHVNLAVFDSWESFMRERNISASRLHLFMKSAKTSFYTRTYEAGDYLVFGSETKGLPPNIAKEYRQRACSLPMPGGVVRSLNLSNAATAVAYEAYREFAGPI